jgi:hypothetical protein
VEVSVSLERVVDVNHGKACRRRRGGRRIAAPRCRDEAAAATHRPLRSRPSREPQPGEGRQEVEVSRRHPAAG